MNKVFYKVGRDGYFTRCNDYASALKQKAEDSDYQIITCYEEIEEPKAEPTPKRKILLEQFGRVPATAI